MYENKHNLIKYKFVEHPKQYIPTSAPSSSPKAFITTQHEIDY